MEHRSFRAMGTEMELFVAAGPGPETAQALDDAEAEFERLESLLSRFRPGSELSQLNREGRIEAGDDLLAVVELSLEARDRTGGRFDPTVHDALVAAGYDRTFDDLPPDGPAAPGQAGPCAGRLRVDPVARTIELEEGARLDLGGIGKGYAADRAAALLANAGPALVDAGGDIATRGRPDALGWRVGVETADGVLTLALGDGAVATSGRDRRHWRRGGAKQHHLIDPSTGLPAGSDLVRATVVAPTAVEAEALAKALFLAGERDAVVEAETLGVPSVLVTADGRTVLTGALT